MSTVSPPTPVLVARQTLADPDLQAEFARVGFVKLHLLDDEAVDRLRAIYDEIFPEELSGFIPTYAVPMPDRKAVATERVRAELGPAVLPLFDRHRAFNSSFLMKYPGDDSALPLHQDVTYVNERVFRTAVAWVALDDADDELDNGPLQVVPGSHRFDHMYRGTHTWWPYGGVTDFLEEHCLVSLPVRRGDVLIMDNALIHCSFPNRTDRSRLAVALALAPEEAELVHAIGDESGTLSIYDVDEAFFVDETPYTLMDHGLPERYSRREVTPVEPLVFTEDELVELCGLPEDTVTHSVTGAPASDEVGTGAVGADPGDQPAGDDSAEHVGEGEGDGDGDGEDAGPGRVAMAVGLLMKVNNRAVRQAEVMVPVLDPAAVGWARPLEAGWEDIRDEARAVLDSRTVPRIEEVVGRSQGNVGGDWQTFVLIAHRHAIPSNTARCPATTDLIARVPGLQSALFSVFQPGTHLPAHRGPNRGVLRYHLSLIVPEPAGSCRLRVVDETLAYTEGESILFDDTFEHEAWNEGDGPRVTLMLEVVRPLSAPYRQFNELTQRAFGLYPEARGTVERVEQLEWVLNGDRAVTAR